jgi:TPR repeat protein
MADKARKRPADAIDLTEETSPQEKKMRASINDVAADLLCPITQELPFDPVIAKDGKIYERTAILEWFRKKDGDATSPSTGKVMDMDLVPAVQVRNTIESLIKSGAIEGEAAKAWRKKLADETRVKEWRAKAEGGDGYAMYCLGVCYENGQNGLAKDTAKARAWYERSAAVRCPPGLAASGEALLHGIGGPQDIALGLVNATEAAYLGSNLGAMLLGEAFLKGQGVPKDHVRARFWLKKAVDDECSHKHLGPGCLATAANCLKELDAIE